MRVLVFGAGGFIGRHLVRGLLRRGYEVTGIYKDKYDIVNNAKINQIILNITKEEEFNKLESNFDCVFNVSAYVSSKNKSLGEDRKCFLVNGIGTNNILRFVLNSNIPLCIHSSTASVYGNPNIIPIGENDTLQPDSIYGISKRFGEELCEMYAHKYKINVTVLRYPSVYGEDCKQNTVLPLLVNKAQRNENITLMGNGLRSQDFLYVDDVVSANLLAAEKKIGGIYNIGSGKETSMIALAKEIIKFTGSKSEIVFNKNVKEANFRMLLDISKAKEKLGYTPYFDLEMGLRKYIDWIKRV